MRLHHRRRHRWPIVCVALLSLWFQQVALAAYVCAIGPATAAASAALGTCHEDAISGAHEDRRDLARCRTHCNPPTATTDAAAPLGVPPCAVPALPVLSDAHTAVVPERIEPPSRHATSPPIPIAYCTLLI